MYAFSCATPRGADPGLASRMQLPRGEFFFGAAAGFPGSSRAPERPGSAKESLTTMAEPIVLAFSGGLDTSFCVPWLKEKHGRDVITVIVDTGGLDDAERARLAAQSKQLGATAHHCIDARAEFFDETIRHLIAGDALRCRAY